jgi:hypothetical protein
MAQVFTFVLTGMEETSDALEASIQIPQRPATESRDRRKGSVLSPQGSRVFSEHPLDFVCVLKVLVAGRPYGWTAAETRSLLIRCAEAIREFGHCGSILPRQILRLVDIEERFQLRVPNSELFFVHVTDAELGKAPRIWC